MPEITLDDINDAADKKYGPLVIRGIPGGDVTLLPLTRVSKATRAEILKLINAEQKAAKKPAKAPSKVTASTAKKSAAQRRAEVETPVEDAEESLKIVDRLERALELATQTPEQAKRLLAYLDGDLGKIEFLVSEWVGATKAGEAQASPS